VFQKLAGPHPSSAWLIGARASPTAAAASAVVIIAFVVIVMFRLSIVSVSRPGNLCRCVIGHTADSVTS